MKVYVAYCHNRHIEPEVTVWRDPQQAIQHARDYMRKAVAHPEALDEQKVEGYLLFIQYYYEGDEAFVVECEIR